MNASMIGITFALVFAGILQTHLQRVLEMEYMQVQSQIELFYWLRLAAGAFFIIGALMFIYSALGPARKSIDVKSRTLTPDDQSHNRTKNYRHGA